MKKLEFETSKGRFVVIDNNQDDTQVIQFLKDIPYSSYMNRIKLSDISEEQASEIVDKVMNNQHFQNYNFKSYNDRWVKTAIESLHSLLKSKGITYLSNKYIFKI